MEIGATVRMTGDCKARLVANGCGNYVTEFGVCIGTVLGLVGYGTTMGPEVDVRWQPSGLRYAHHPRDLEEVTDGAFPL